MAFAMKLAKNETTSDKCEFVSAELKALLEEASHVQQVEIEFGSEANQVKVGGETVLFNMTRNLLILHVWLFSLKALILALSLN